MAAGLAAAQARALVPRQGRPPLLLVGHVGGRPAVHVHSSTTDRVGDADRGAAEWLEDHRTPTWNTLTHYGSMLSDTLVKVILVAVVGGAW